PFLAGALFNASLGYPQTGNLPRITSNCIGHDPNSQVSKISRGVIIWFVSFLGKRRLIMDREES
ncbi:hypothetical protein, partial [Paenibacillus lactis]|uniref:hypothetical protein n=1 Tax=Paenibacillus lactis TaxID=228574 RepID=UPI0036AF6B1E